jgi:hypothetical protein
MAANPIRLLGRAHVRATPEGAVTLRLRAAGAWRATLELTSARRVSSRWLTRGRPRTVRLARRTLTVHDGDNTVTVQLPTAQLALVRRMQSLQIAVRVTATDAAGRRARASRLMRLHAPARVRAR